jgi:hypothetical protein
MEDDIMGTSLLERRPKNKKGKGGKDFDPGDFLLGDE